MSIQRIISDKVFLGKDTYVIPQSVEIDLTNACNQACSYCNVEEYRAKNPDVGSFKDYITLIDRLKDWPEWARKKGYDVSGEVKTITFVGGGEPSISPFFRDAVVHALQLGFLVSIVTNGSKVDKIIDLPSALYENLAWVGVDMDSLDPVVYENIRRSKNKRIFELVKRNITKLAQVFPRVDLKILLVPDACDQGSLETVFEFASRVKCRMIYFRLAFLGQGMFDPGDHVYSTIQALSQKYSVTYKINRTRLLERNYSKCHALFMLPVFGAEGRIHLCCENRGIDSFSLTSWVDDDFRSEWCSSVHDAVYDRIDVSLCKPCRPHRHNLAVEQIWNKNSYMDDWFL